MIISRRFDHLIWERDRSHNMSDHSFKLGIMGGTFDPIHWGHLVTAEHARDKLGLSGVIFMPTGNPAQKVDTYVSEPHHRAEMVSRAIAQNEQFDISYLEIDRPALTYTIDTLRELKAYYPPWVELYFITGADAILDIVTWKDAAEFGKLATFVAATRPGYDLSQRDTVLKQVGGDIQVITLEIPALAISSTYLRDQIKKGRSISYLTDPAVVDYIGLHGLYR